MLHSEQFHSRGGWITQETANIWRLSSPRSAAPIQFRLLVARNDLVTSWCVLSMQWVGGFPKVFYKLVSKSQKPIATDGRIPLLRVTTLNGPLRLSSPLCPRGGHSRSVFGQISAGARSLHCHCWSCPYSVSIWRVSLQDCLVLLRSTTFSY